MCSKVEKSFRQIHKVYENTCYIFYCDSPLFPVSYYTVGLPGRFEALEVDKLFMFFLIMEKLMEVRPIPVHLVG